MSDEKPTTLAVFMVDHGKNARHLLEALEKVDAIDANVQIVDAAIVDHTRLGRVKIHQTSDRGPAKGGFHGGAIGVVVGAIVLGPAGAVAAGAAGALLGSLVSRFHDVGINDKFMKDVSKEIAKGKNALFVQYEGSWANSIGLVEEAIKAQNALLIQSTLPAETAAALRRLVEPAAEALGGEEVVADYEVDVATEEAPAEEAPLPRRPPAPVAEAVPVMAAAAAAPSDGDDLTQLVGIGPKAASALAAAGITTYAALAETNEPQLRHALHEADMVPPGNVATWPMQATYAVKGDWQGLMKHNHQAPRRILPRQRPGRGGRGDQGRRPDPDPRHRPADLVDPQRLGHHVVRAARAREHRRSPHRHRHRRRAAAVEPRLLADPGRFAARGDWSGLATYNQRH